MNMVISAMFKKLISILLIVSIAMTLCRFTIPYLWYFSNYDYIVHELCINRNNPHSDCKGMCQLKMMVKKQHHHDDQKQAPRSQDEQRVNLFFTDYFTLLNKIPSLSRRFPQYDDQSKSLWFGEPSSPPPQLI